jgi:hypothetical protein
MSELGIEIPEILLPHEADLSRWAVIACDQFTQDRAYWEKAREAAGGKPSALNLIFPEAFLADDDHAERIKNIHRAMRDYAEGGVFAAPRRGLVYIERDTPFNRGRRGLVAAVDLEQYDWSPDARPLIRSTEGTVAERLPPRMDIRRGAPLELPHILLLIDDDEDFLLRGLGERAQKKAPAYQGDLMLNSGSISGWFLDARDEWAFLSDGLEKLLRRSLTRYGGGGQPFLFAVGDGNHSLASAKGIWEEYKATHVAAAGALPVHPCRYALVEIENIYDPAIQFEPIHRVMFGLDFDDTLKLLAALPDFTSRIIASREELVRLTAESVKGNRFGIVSRNDISGGRYALVTTSASGISTASLQPLLDQAVGGSSGLSIDYIHGEDELFRLASERGGSPATGILLPPVQKDGFFETVARCGPLPRKSFSMGEAEEKRFYIECRKLFG